MSLIQHCLPDMNELDRISTFDKLMLTAKVRAEKKTEVALKALRLLDGEDDRAMFQTLKERLEDSEREQVVVARFGGTKAAATFFTPGQIKGLRPDVTKSKNTTTLNSILVWQQSKQSFHGYYPRAQSSGGDGEDPKARTKKYVTHSRKYADDNEDAQLQALWSVVLLLWKEHKRQGGPDDSKPNKDQCREALQLAAKDIAEGKCEAVEEPTNEAFPEQTQAVSFTDKAAPDETLDAPASSSTGSKRKAPETSEPAGSSKLKPKAVPEAKPHAKMKSSKGSKKESKKDAKKKEKKHKKAKKAKKEVEPSPFLEGLKVPVLTDSSSSD